MKITTILPSDVGCRVRGVGLSPSTGQRLDNKVGELVDFTRDYGDDQLHVQWDGEKGVDIVAQDNAIGTGTW